MEYSDDVHEEFGNLWFSFRGSSRKDLKPWHWENCKIWFEKNSENTIRFTIKRTNNISLDENTKLRWDKRQKNTDSQVYSLHYVLHFELQNCFLPNTIHEEKIEQMYGDKKDCWVLNLDPQHKIWKWKDDRNEAKNIMTKILESIKLESTKIKDDSQYFSPVNVHKRHVKLNMSIQPVIYHPADELRVRQMRNFIREIHLAPSESDNKILVTIVYNNEQLRENAWLDCIYRVFRKLRYGRTFDVESFSIVLENGYPTKFDFPDIYSGCNKLEKDNIHCKKCGITIENYFSHDVSKPVIFINTSNHAMAGMDNNSGYWKIVYRLWDEKCPIYVGTNTRCEIEKYLSKHGIEPLFRECNDSKYFSCSERK